VIRHEVRRLVLRGAQSALVSVGLLCIVTAPAAGASPPQLSVRAAILIEQSTGRELYGVNPNQELAIASTTKLMTALLTLEHERRLSKVFSQNDYYPSAADSQIGLVPGERMSVHDLLLALMLPSADDAAEDLAYNLGHGSVGQFVGMMDARARQLGLTHTHYSTPSGLDTPGNYSSASDLVKLASYDLTHSRFFARIVALPSAVLRSGDRVRYVVNRNDLVGRVPWINGVKTGHTIEAGYVLVASGHRDGMTLLSAVLGTADAGSRDADTLALLDYGFANFHFLTPVRKGSVLARPTVRYRAGVRADVIASRTFRQIFPRSISVRTTVQAPRQLRGPLAAGSIVGTAIVRAGARVVARVPLVLKRSLPAVSGLTIAARAITRPLPLVMIAVVVVSAAGLSLVRYRRGFRVGRPA
jgi:D-alanyl-D-alanine carboxypeptidase (penicillin-binding protein 5/6)